MKELSEIYGKEFFSARRKVHWRAPIVVGAIRKVLNPESVVDVGCSTADLVREWNRNLIPAVGIEGDNSCLEFAVTDKIVIQDLRILNKPIGWFDLCTSFEVAEHIEPEYASRFSANLVNLSDRLLISAAPPGQGGTYHVNCKSLSYWQEIFSSFGYIHNEDVVTKIREELEQTSNIRNWPIKVIHKNLSFFEKT